MPITRAMPGNTWRKGRARQSRPRRARARWSPSSPEPEEAHAVPRAPLLSLAYAQPKCNYVRRFESARVYRRRLQACAFSRHPRRSAAGRILRGSRRELHGRRRAAARAARRVARTLCVVGAWRRAVDWFDAAARSRPSRAAKNALRSLRAGEFLRTSRLVVARRRVLQRPSAAPLYTADAGAGRRAYRRGTDGAWTPDVARKSIHLHSVFRKHDRGGRLPCRDIEANRMRVVARHQQRFRVGKKPRHSASAISGVVSAGSGEGNSSRRA